MEKDDLAKRNLDLLDDFMRYAFDHPATLDQIPQDVQIVILPTDDPELSAQNRQMASALCARGEKVVLIKLRKPERFTHRNWNCLRRSRRPFQGSDATLSHACRY